MGFPKFLEDLDPNIYLSNNYIVLDFETTTEEKGSPLNEKNSIILASWWTPWSGMKTKVGSEYEMPELLADIERADFVVAHNSKFELGWLRRCGADLTKILTFCTQIAEVVLTGNKLAGKLKQQSLEHVSRSYGHDGKMSLVSKMIKAGMMEYIPTSWLVEYCELDVRLTRDVFLEQRAELVCQGKLAVLYTRCLTTSVLADIEFNGLHLDRERVTQEYNKYRKEADEVAAELDKLTGGINFRSRFQVAHFVYGDLGFEELVDKRTKQPIRNAPSKQFPDGTPKVDSATLLQLKPKNKRQREFMKLKKKIGKLDAALTKNLEFFKGVVDEHDGVFYGMFNQTATQTHRLSGSGRSILAKLFKSPKGVQFQNLPRIFKRLFSARRKGWLVGECDSSQLEFRGAAFLGQDKAAVKSIVDKEDVHSYTASVINNLTLQEVAEKVAADKTGNDIRTLAKSRTFKPLIIAA